jgi:proteic killer suppression protein
MEIRNVKHKGLKNFIEKNDAKGLPADRLKKIRQVLGFLLDMEAIEELFDPPKFKAHLLTGDRANTYSLSVSGNWRITFRYDAAENELYDMDYEDYH